MEITEQELRRQVAAVDEEHRASLPGLPAAIAELHAGEGRRVMGPTRRQLLRGAGAAGLAVTLGAAVIPVAALLDPVGAAAQALDDKAIAKFAESVELAAVAAYGAAASSGKVTSKAVAEAATTFSSHHAAHARAFGAFAGDTESAKPNPALLAAVGGQLRAATDQTMVVQLAHDLEQAAASTYLFGLGALQSAEARKLAASILPVESQHAFVLSQVLGTALNLAIPAFLSQDQKIDPAKFPPAS